MKDSKVLVVNLSSVCTELARHLVLSGINLVLVDSEVAGHSNSLVSDDDTETDFLFSKDDIGKVRGEVVKSKLEEMNPFVKIEFDSKLTTQSLHAA